MHLHNYTRTQTNTYILTLTHKCKCARACNMHSHTTAVLVTACLPTNTQGLTMKSKSSLFADTFSASLPLSFVLLVKNAHKQEGKIKRKKNILSIFLIQCVGVAKKIAKEKFEIFYTKFESQVTIYTKRKTIHCKFPPLI